VDVLSSARKAHDKKHTKKLAAFITPRTAIARTGRCAEEALHKAEVGTNHPRVHRSIIRTRIIMAPENFSPAVASRREKYDDAFRVSKLLGAKPLDHSAHASPARHENIDTAA
jgi:hypothetical protein